MKFQIRLALILSTIAASFAFAATSNADVINLQSSGAAKFLNGPLDAGFGSSFTPANFSSAQAGASAFVIAPNAAWIQTLPSNNTAQWISTAATSAAGGSGLFALNFNIANPFNTATISLGYAVDNNTGDAQNAGFFLNGNAIAPVGPTGTFTAESTLNNNNVAPFLNVGNNTLYVYLSDAGFDSGVIFSARIVTAVPEPSSLLLISGLVVGGIGFRRFRFAKSRLPLDKASND